ncbi:hypothetical protein [uncultured Kiloniella sp.]|uniref:hypothetical protein n=1 Tax=uncultured Kiloniella sp. TaxID=1133091 RepID=UPI002635F541|nr:hypothetical protein [uncultured Kiloniella sp.]
MIDVFGWWAFDPENTTLINRVSGEKVCFIAKLGPQDSPAEGNWLRFEYQYDGLSYPLLVETGPVIYDTYERYSLGSSYVTRINNKLAWQVDHIRSAKIWAERHNQHSDKYHPSYGLWRRVDDCIADAFSFWPETEKTGPVPERIIIAGGWVNGSWNDRWERTFVTCQEEYQPTTLTSAPLVALDTLPPSPWIFHDTKETDTSKYVGVRDLVKPVSYPPYNAEKEKQEYRFSYIPAEEKLTGFESKTLYLKTEDETSVVALRSGDGLSTGHGPSAHFTFLYGDSEYTGSIYARPKYPAQSPRDWGISCPLSLTFRPRLVEGKMTKEADDLINSTNADLRIWHQINLRLRDAFLEFKDSVYRYDEWHPDLSLSASQNVFCGGNYKGGIKGTLYSSRYLDAPQTLLKRVNLNLDSGMN